MTQTATATAPDTPLMRLLDEEFAGQRDGLPAHLWERALGSPVREFLRRPGKQFRARLVEASWMLGGGHLSAMPEALPLIIEVLHAGSLIVDDIEDGSDVRRDAPSLHRIFGIPQALNTGNWLYFWPFELIERMPLAANVRTNLARRVHVALLRCHRGQALDLSLRVTDLKQAEIPHVVRATTRLKTCALMELGAEIGAIGAGAAAAEVHTVSAFARELGMGLQMLDDLSGITAEARWHKGEEDLLLARPTWPWGWLATRCNGERFASYLQQAREVVAGRMSAEELARGMRDEVAVTGRERVHSRLSLALAILDDAFHSHPAIAVVAEEIERLEKSYG